MPGNTFGSIFRITTFGESHGSAVGVTIDGCPAGVELDERVIQAELDRRRPGANAGVAGTARNEKDEAKILSGVFGGRTTGTPIAIIIENTAQKSADYDNLKDSFRPGHADWTYTAKYGFRDHRGGGRSSARETAGRVAAGAAAKAFLRQRLSHGYRVIAFTLRAAGVSCASIDYSVIDKNPLRAADLEAAARMEEALSALREKGDSAGGIVECVVTGCPAGLGEPVFDKLDAELAKAMLSLGAVKGIEFGSGFAAADSTGSAHNDTLRANGGTVGFASNNAGGILGGISNGEEIRFRIAVKPTASIFMEQQSVIQTENGEYKNHALVIRGRHDVCICPRIVPVVEAMTHLVIADMVLRNDCARC
ncbi:MAG: chorismate synthase [Treponemataceae bacterium]|nr:MAG: chorismate synthase [Treponemataceae bacterium]